MARRFVICDCARIRDPKLATIDQLARLELAARQLGCQLQLRHANAAVLELIELAGLADVLRVEVEREPEEGEQPGGVEEEGELTDPTL
jgi:hypothetical protein